MVPARPPRIPPTPLTMTKTSAIRARRHTVRHRCHTSPGVAAATVKPKPAPLTLLTKAATWFSHPLASNIQPRPLTGPYCKVMRRWGDERVSKVADPDECRQHAEGQAENTRHDGPQRPSCQGASATVDQGSR